MAKLLNQERFIMPDSGRFGTQNLARPADAPPVRLTPSTCRGTA
jgi:hypothetical protein